MRAASALRNVWDNDIENMIMSVRKQMFKLQKCALDLTMAWREFDLTRKGCDPSVKSGLLDQTEFTRGLARCGIFMATKEIAAIARNFGDTEAYPGQCLIKYEEFGESLREGMSKRRADLIRSVYQKIDSYLPISYNAHPVTGDLKEVKEGMTLEFLLEHYYADMHPMVRANTMSADEALRQMKDGLENGPMDADGDG